MYYLSSEFQTSVGFNLITLKNNSNNISHFRTLIQPLGLSSLLVYEKWMWGILSEFETIFVGLQHIICLSLVS